MKYISLIILTCLVAFNAVSQNLSDLPAAHLKTKGKNAIMYKDPYSAIEYFEAFLKKKKDNAEAMFELAECYRETRNYINALKWYKKAFKANEKKYLVAQYYWGTMLMTQKNYKEAKEVLNKFKKASSNNKSLKTYNKLARSHMSGCRTAMRDSGNVVWMDHIDNSVNKPSVESSPILLDGNTLLFSSLRTDTTLYEVGVENYDELPVRQFYVAKRNGDDWNYISKWNGVPFNQKGINTSNGAFSPDKNRFYFTRCAKNWKYETICKIYQSTKQQDDTWTDPVALPAIINDPKYTATQPAVGTYSKRDEEILYFVSNRSGGRGGYDIWYSRYNKRKNTWRTPKNCGSKINSEGNEFTPFIEMEERTMFFSSDGGEGWGQLDIYKSIGEQSKWMPIENMKPPINSPYDDLYYTISENLSDGFFVSNRPHEENNANKENPTCCDDIYSFKYDEVIRIKALGTVYAKIDNKFKSIYGDKFDDSNVEPLPDSSFKLAEGVAASLFIIDETAPMGSGNMVYIKSDTIDANGNYSFNLEAGKEYVIEIENYGYFNRMLNTSTMLYNKSDTMYLDTIGIDIMPKEPLIVKNIYYEFGEAELPRAAKKIIDSTLLKLMLENSQIIIEISSHTDNKGREKLNKELSQKRADGVKKYLIKKGIDKKRLYAKGYGEERPIAPNETPDGEDNPEGREKNRRTEFTIIGSLDQYAGVVYED